MYKLLVKILLNKLQKLLEHLIGPVQNVFVKDKHIQDNILLAYELVYKYNRKHISSRTMIKVDMRKAYDIIE